MFCFILGGHANVLSQYKLNVKLGETTYRQLFDEIRKQTGCIVMYSDNMLDKNGRIKADFDNVELDEVLQQVLAGKGLTFETNDEFITIYRAIPQAQQKSVVISGKVTDKTEIPFPVCLFL